MENIISNNSNILIILGFFLIFLEFIIPGIYIIFIGLGLITVGLLGLLFSLSIPVKVGLLFFVSVTFSFFGQKILQKLFPSITKKNFDFLKDEYIGKVVTVTQTIQKDGSNFYKGRISYQGTEWDAISHTDTILKNEKCVIKKMNNLTFEVEKFE